jgi:hypothetical protein
MIDMICNESAISHRWGAIKEACSEFHGHLETIKYVEASEWQEFARDYM